MTSPSVEGMHIYYLPDEADGEQCHKTAQNSVVILGPNGSGKSRLGAWMEKKHPESIWRLSALRDLTFPEVIPLSGFSTAMHRVEFNTEDVQPSHDRRYEYSRSTNSYRYTTSRVSNFDHTLAALLARLNDEDRTYRRSARECDNAGKPLPHPPDTVEERLQRLWGDVFPHRMIKLNDGKVEATVVSEAGKDVYNGSEMSDGERAGLYIMAQVLCIEPGKTVIVDEPELHMHRSIMYRLWKVIEAERSDCLFIHITHDTQFAADHIGSDKIWIKSFDGTQWDLEVISSPEVPEALLFDILGNRKPVLFVEGELTSLDYRLFSALYPDHYVVPCSSCETVITQTKAFRKLRQLHHLEVHGIVDRDRRSEDATQELAKVGVHMLAVAEVENLFLVEGVLDAVCRNQKLDSKAVEQAKDIILSKVFAPQIERLAEEAFIAEVRHRLERVTFTDKSLEGVKQSIKGESERVGFLQEQINSDFHEAASDYAVVLKLLNSKGAVKSVGKSLGVSNDDYCGLVIRLLQGEGNTGKAIRDALTLYLPDWERRPSDRTTETFSSDVAVEEER